MRRAAKVDDNQKQIVSELRQLGASVAVTSAVGKGFPDLIVGFLGVTYLVEVKQKGSEKRLSKEQIDFHETWRGNPVLIITSTDDFLNIIN